MDIPSFLFNQDLAGSLITIAGQSILVSLIGITITRLISGKSAPVRSLACLAIIIAMGLVATVSVGLRLSGVSWSQTTIPVSRDTGKIDNRMSFLMDKDLPPILISPVFLTPPAVAEKNDIDRSIMPTLFYSRLFTLPASFYINFLGFVWLTGILFQLSKLGYGILLVKNFRNTLKNNKYIPFNDMLRKVAGTFWKNRLPSLYSSPLIDSPITIGLFKPIVIIPEKLLPALSENELRSILLHELAHIYHYDQVIGVLKRMVIAIFWWNPFLYIINREHEQAREEVSDNYVLSELTPRVYIQCLMALAEKVCLISKYPTAAGMAGRRFDLNIRVEQILSKKRNLSRCTRSSLKGVAVSICLVLTLGIAGLHAYVESGKMSASSAEYYETPSDFNFSPVNTVEEEQTVSKNNIIETEESEKTLPVNIKPTKKDRPANQPQKSDKVPRENEKSNLAMVSDNIKVEEKVEKQTDAPALQPIENNFLENEDNHKVLLAKKDPAAENPPVPSASVSREVSYIKSGVLYLKNGQINNAIAEFSKAINLAPRKAVAYTARGSAYFRLNQLDKATSDYNKAIEINPNFATAYQNRGSLFFQQGKFDNALLDYNKAIELKPDMAASYIDRGNIYQRRDRMNEAISDYSKALELNPNDAETYITRGIAYYSQEQYQKAFADFNVAIDLDPGSVSAYIYQGYSHQAKSQYRRIITGSHIKRQVYP